MFCGLCARRRPGRAGGGPARLLDGGASHGGPGVLGGRPPPGARRGGVRAALRPLPIRARAPPAPPRARRLAPGRARAHALRTQVLRALLSRHVSQRLCFYNNL